MTYVNIIEYRTTNQQKKDKYNCEKKLANNVKTDPKSFYAFLTSKSKTKTSVGPLKNGDGVLILDYLEMSEILNSYFGSVFTKENLCDNFRKQNTYLKAI